MGRQRDADRIEVDTVMLKDIVPGFVRSLIGRAYHRLFQGVSVGPGSRVDFSTRFEGHNRIGSNCRIGGCVLGAGTYIADGTTATHVRFGRFCSCGENVSFGLARHPTRDFASTHPAFFSTQRQAGFTFVQADSFAEHVYADAEGHWLVSVGNDVWIGNRAIVLDGVTIHDGAVVGAGAVVTRDVPAYSIVAGVPAETIGRRFEGATVKALLDSRWWDADFDVLRQNAEYFTNADLLLEQLDRLTGTL